MVESSWFVCGLEEARYWLAGLTGRTVVDTGFLGRAGALAGLAAWLMGLFGGILGGAADVIGGG